MGAPARRARSLAAGRGRQCRRRWRSIVRSASTKSIAITIGGRPEHERRDLAGKRLLLVAACALVDADGRVLLAQRPEGKQLAGLWEFPGGKVEPGETPEQRIIRELHEEIGIETEIPCLAPLTFASHSYDDFHLLMPLFVCRRFRGIAQPKEGQALKWVRPKQMRDYPMPPADAPLIPFLIDLLVSLGLPIDFRLPPALMEDLSRREKLRKVARRPRVPNSLGSDCMSLDKDWDSIRPDRGFRAADRRHGHIAHHAAVRFGRGGAGADRRAVPRQPDAVASRPR